LGAGNRPEKAREAAKETIEEIKKLFMDGTKMAFITAGMGGGTGTGAAPIIAGTAKEMGILTVGIVTIPFKFEGNKKIDQALDGVDEMAKNVDALLVINNERLREIYPDLTVLNAFGKADDTLSVAAKSIAEIITLHGLMNLDFNDVKTVLKDGGVAIMSTGYGEGENRVSQAIQNALHSPLLSNNDIFNSKKILLSVSFSNDKPENELKMEEMNEVNSFMERFKQDVETKTGLFTDPELNDRVKVTILASGFGLDVVDGMEDLMEARAKEEARLTKEDEELVEKNDIRRGHYYGTGSEIRKKSHAIFRFTQDELGNDDVISLVDESPTYKRKKEMVERFHTRGNVNGNDPSADTHVITFS
jgi:cell division protein FtsZ